MAIRRRKRAVSGRPWIALEDAKLAAALPVLWLLASTFPERRWRTICYCLESIRGSMGLADAADIQRTAARVIGRSREGFDASSFAREAAAGATEHHLQVLRSRSRGGWKAMLRLEGAAHLDAALDAGKGAVLWVAHFCFHALATKKALHAAGYRLWHLSRPEHGFAKSAVGIALYNGIRTGAEGEHLAGRIVYQRDRPSAAAIAAKRVLMHNGIVSITAGDWEGQRLASVDICGGKLELAVGPPRLARLSGAALLPVFTVRGAVHDAIRVVIEPALAVPPDGDGNDALEGAAESFGRLLEHYVMRYPTEWLDWKKLEMPRPDR